MRQQAVIHDRVQAAKVRLAILFDLPLDRISDRRARQAAAGWMKDEPQVHPKEERVL